jgi:hypothetical protein
MVRVLGTPCAVGVTDVGLNVPVAPAGRPLTLRFTALEKPFTAVTVTV